MKKVLFCLFIAFLCSTVYSKDYIIKKDGQNVDCTAITGEDDSNIYFHFYSGEEEVNTFIKKSDVKEYNFSKRENFLKEKKIEAEKREKEKLLKEKRLNEKKEKDSLAAVNAKSIEFNKIQKQKERDSLAAVNAKLLGTNKIQSQREKDSLAIVNAKSIEFNKIQKQKEKDSLAVVHAKSIPVLNALPKSVVAINTMPRQEVAQTDQNQGSNEGFIYAEIVGTSGFFTTKVTIQIDFGQKQSFWNDNSTLRDDKGSAIKFNSMVDAMNFMGGLGWEFAQAYAVTMGNQNVYHFLLKKKASKDELQKMMSLTKATKN